MLPLGKPKACWELAEEEEEETEARLGVGAGSGLLPGPLPAAEGEGRGEEKSWLGVRKDLMLSDKAREGEVVEGAGRDEDVGCSR